jgi:peptidyl-prolyl cis-trans isomerase D
MAIIGKIRKRGGLAVTIVAIAILAFIFSDLLTRGKGDSVPNKIASIDGMDVNINEFNTRCDMTEKQARNQAPDGKLSQEQTFQTKLMAFQQLVGEKLLNRECGEVGVSVGEEELSDMFLGTFISNIARQQFTDPKTGQYSVQTVKQIMAQYDKLSPEQQQAWQEMKNNAKSERLQQKYGNLLAKSFYMPKAMAKHISDTYDQVTDSRYTCLPYSSIDDNQIKLTGEDYQKYYNEHKNQFYRAEEAREVEFVKFEVLPSPSDIKKINDSAMVTFNELQTTTKEDMPSFVQASSDAKYDSNYYTRDNAKISTYFPDSILAGKTAGSFIFPHQIGNSWVMGKVMNIQDRPDSVKFSVIAIFNNKIGASEIKRTPEAEKKIVDSLYNAIKGDSKLFESNVAKYSDDPNTKDNFGDQGWVLDGQLQEDMFSQIMSCAVNGVFVYHRPDGAGDYIIKVTNKTEFKNKIQLAQIVMGIRPSDKTIGEVRDKANIFLSKAKDLASMKTQAQKQNLNVLTSSVGAMSYQLDGTPYAREVVCWAFSNKTNKGDVAPEIYELQNLDQFQDMFLIVGLKDIQPKGIMTLEQLKANPEFEKLVKIDKKAEKLIAKAKTIMQTAKTIDEFVVKSNTVVDTAMGIDFSAPYFAKSGPEMRVIGTLSAVRNIGLQKPIKGFNGVYVVQVDKISKRPQKEDVNMIRQQYAMQMNQRMQQVSPIQVLYEKAKVKNYFVQYVNK